MDDRTWPTEQDLLKGEMPDGSLPPLHSNELVEPYAAQDWYPELPANIRHKDPTEMTAEELHLVIDLNQLHQIDEALNYGRMMIRQGMSVMAGREAVEQNRDLRRSRTCVDRTSIDTTGAAVNPGGDKRTNADKAESASERGTSQPARRSPGEGGTPFPAIPKEPLREPFRMNMPREPKSKPAQDSLRETKGAALKQVVDGETGDCPGSSGLSPSSSPSEADSESVNSKAQDAVDDGDRAADAVHRDGTHSLRESQNRGQSPSGPSPRSAASTQKSSRQLSPQQMLVMGERGVKLVMKLAPVRAEIAHRVVDRARAVDIKEEFFEDRAVGVVKHTLCALDESYRELGFTGWMPFRHADQWLMFCGVMQRVLAANGLIHSEHAEVYRKLLEETLAPIEPDYQTPESWPKCHRSRPTRTMHELKTRITHEVDKPPWPS